MEAFAAAGYLVVAPNHRDAACAGGEAQWKDKAQAPFRQPERWSDASYRDRADDIRRLVAALVEDPRFRTRADLPRLALAGHSLGGYTVLGLAGGWPSWKLPGVKAVLALSPYSQPYLAQRTLAQLSAPVMYQGGTLDFGVTPALHKSMGAYAQSSRPKYYVEFERVGHFAWTNIGQGNRKTIAAYSVAFLDHYVKGDPATSSLTGVLPGVAVFRYTSDAGVRD